MLSSWYNRAAPHSFRIQLHRHTACLPFFHLRASRLHRWLVLLEIFAWKTKETFPRAPLRKVFDGLTKGSEYYWKSSFASKFPREKNEFVPPVRRTLRRINISFREGRGCTEVRNCHSADMGIVIRWGLWEGDNVAPTNFDSWKELMRPLVLYVVPDIAQHKCDTLS